MEHVYLLLVEMENKKQTTIFISGWRQWIPARPGHLVLICTSETVLFKYFIVQVLAAIQKPAVKYL